MNRKSPLLPVFVVIMFLCALFLAVIQPLSTLRAASLADVRLSLETSQGRERKQQHEYEEVQEELPKTRQELAEVQPQAEEAAQRVAELKERRKALREEKKALEAQLAEQNAVSGPEEQEDQQP